MHKTNKEKLTPYQRMEQEIRAEADSGETISRPRAGQRKQSDLNEPQRVNRAGQTGASLPGADPTDDDLSPETLIHEDGANSPYEAGSGAPADETLSISDEDGIGAGYGLDEAELGRVRPLDGKPWSPEANPGTIKEGRHGDRQ